MVATDADAPSSFSERDFYLREFRGRTLALAAPRAEDLAHPGVAEALRVLTAGGGRALLLGTDPRLLVRHAKPPVLREEAPRLEGELWRRLHEAPVQAVQVPPDAFATHLRTLARRLGLFKVVWLDPGGGLRSRREGRHSFVHLEELRGWLAQNGEPLATRERLALWREVGALLEAGVPAVNVCDPAGLADELFTYDGSGTLFTRERYVAVRPLSIDDYDAAYDLVKRGVREGYLAPRPPEEVDRVLAAAFGAFVEGRDLAGIASLLRWDRTGEIGSLYTLTRFLGEGVGQHLVAFAVERARAEGLRGVFACTTSGRVGDFFERQGFVATTPDALPPAKWAAYDPERRRALRSYWYELGPLREDGPAGK